MSIISSIVGPIVSPVVTGLVGGGGFDSLAFHALDDVNGVYSNDVIVGTGVLAEADTSTRYYPDDTASPIWQPFTTGVPGKAYAGGKWWLVGQAASTNEITYSRNLANAAWTKLNGLTVTYDATGLQSDANGASTLADSSASYEFIQETVPVLADTNTHTARFFVVKDTDETRFPEFFVKTNGAGAPSAQESYFQINTKTGASVALRGTPNIEVNPAGDWWEVLSSIVGDGIAISANLEIAPSGGNVFGSTDVAATGSIIDGNTCLVLNRSIASLRSASPIFTAGATGSINVTDLSFDIANHDNTNGGYFIEWTPQFATSEASGNIEIISLNGGADLLYYDATNSLLKSTDGTNTASVALTIVAGTTYKLWVAWGSNLQVGVGAATGIAVAYDGAFATGAKMEIIARPGFTQFVRNIRRYNQSFASVVPVLQALAA